MLQFSNSTSAKGLRGHFKSSTNLEPKMIKENMNFLKSIRIIAFVATIVFSMSACGGGSSNSSKVPDATESTPPVISSSDTDELIADFEEAVNQYISVVQAIASGDFTASADVEMLEDKVKSLASQLTRAESELTDAQKLKFSEINNNFASSGN